MHWDGYMYAMQACMWDDGFRGGDESFWLNAELRKWMINLALSEFRVSISKELEPSKQFPLNP